MAYAVELDWHWKGVKIRSPNFERIECMADIHRTTLWQVYSWFA